jgi:hypothetical protein
MQGDPETGYPMGQGGEWGFIAFLHYLMAEMSFRCKQAFPRKEKCLLDHLSPFGTSCIPSFSPSSFATIHGSGYENLLNILLNLTEVKLSSICVYFSTCFLEQHLCNLPGQRGALLKGRLIKQFFFAD